MEGTTISAPIPRRLLPHSATFKKRTGVDSWGKATYTDYTAKFIRFEPSKKTALQSLGDAKDDIYTLFVDSVNSKFYDDLGAIASVSIKAEDQFVFGGNTVTVRDIDEEYGDSDKVHHYEVYLK